MNVLIAGDFVPRRRIAAQIEAGDYSCLEQLKPIIQSSDYAIVNFESPVVSRDANPISKTGPNLCCTEKAMECVAQAGFKCVTLANNHFRDYGQIGVEDTLEACVKNGVDYVGGGKNLLEARRILYKEICGQRLAIINVCEHEWSIVTDEYGGSNPLDVVAVSRNIKEARAQANYVLVIVHGGTEHYNLPTPRMKETYRFFIELGADAVVNHHQHCFSGHEVYREKPIFYGLGNFCFDKPKPKDDVSWENGFMVQLELSDSISFKMHPYSQCTEDDSFIRTLKDTEEFEHNLAKLNHIIVDDDLLAQKFEELSRTRISTARDILVPYSSTLAQRLYTKGLLPSFVSERRLRQLLAHTQCEAHRDILLHGIKLNLKK